MLRRGVNYREPLFKQSVLKRTDNIKCQRCSVWTQPTCAEPQSSCQMFCSHLNVKVFKITEITDKIMGEIQTIVKSID